jgi:TPR repeat protein
MHFRGIGLFSCFLAAAISLAAQTPVPDPSLLAKANSGDAAAQIAIGESYAAGNGVARDCKIAGEWFGKAAQSGSVAGELRLATFYRDGAKGCPRDMAQAAQWYRKAAEQGDVAAQGILGVLYSYGQGVKQDYVEAYFWLDLAASVSGPEQAHYAANRQMVGVHITTDDLEALRERVAKWKATHPR